MKVSSTYLSDNFVFNDANSKVIYLKYSLYSFAISDNNGESLLTLHPVDMSAHIPKCVACVQNVIISTRLSIDILVGTPKNES